MSAQNGHLSQIITVTNIEPGITSIFGRSRAVYYTTNFESRIMACIVILRF